MKRTLFILFLTFNLCGYTQSQAEMNAEAYEEYSESDKLLNDVYKVILSKYKTDTLFITNLKKSQRLWVKFRDAEMEMKYPDYSEENYGSVQPTCRALYLKELTDQRVETLKVWVRGIEEGDVCTGSVQIVEWIDSDYMGKAQINKNGSIWMNSNMNKDHRIFGYKKANVNSTKMILISIFTNEVEFNPFNCKYGAYYDTSGMTDLQLKYISTENEFLRIQVIKNNKNVDEIFMLKECFEFVD
ncbi:lysozyme inhibitor LprI family protein [Crocinitomix catalasitica]|uniref:lysozyme inhibitor LprI family protein n=1 Tax=Crocinitomix catalasitica TaxID=184607 RepID=UPI000A06070F|nr:lysozyme inhibitor LprI family protein [Crocinitomix catalasitica]